MLCLLAKVDSDGLAFDATTSQSNSNNGDQDSSITVVVQEGLEVRLPMAGQLFTVHILATTPNVQRLQLTALLKGGARGLSCLVVSTCCALLRSSGKPCTLSHTA